MFKIWYPAFGWYLDPEFESIENAKEYGFAKGFSFLVINQENNEIEYQSPSFI